MYHRIAVSAGVPQWLTGACCRRGDDGGAGDGGGRGGGGGGARARARRGPRERGGPGGVLRPEGRRGPQLLAGQPRQAGLCLVRARCNHYLLRLLIVIPLPSDSRPSVPQSCSDFWWSNRL